MEVLNQKADSMPEVLGQGYRLGCLRAEGNKKDTRFMRGFFGKTTLTPRKDEDNILFAIQEQSEGAK